MTAEEFATLLTFATAMSFTPGPNTMLATALAANFGMRRTWRFIVAVPTGWTLMMIACGLGLGALVFALPWLRSAVKAIGVAYLVWLAWKLANTRALAPAAAARMQVGFWQGVALQFVNIKAWMLALAIVSGWIAGHADFQLRLAVVMPVMLAFAFVSNLSYALVGSLLRDWLAGPAGSGQRLIGFNRIMSAVLVLTAIWMLVI